MKSILVVLCAILLSSVSSFAADLQQELQNPRGNSIKIDIYNPGLPKVLLLGQGQGCAPRLELYEALAKEGRQAGFTVIRIYWAYCVADPQGGASQDLSAEKEDFATALNFIRQELGYQDSQVYVGGKSLGSFVSQEIFNERKSLNALVLLTPVCTDSQTDPNNHKNVFAEYYPSLAAETRPVFLLQGNQDPLCETAHFQEYLNGKPSNFVSLVAKGDHSFGVKNPDGQYNPELGAKNLIDVSEWLFSKIK